MKVRQRNRDGEGKVKNAPVSMATSGRLAQIARWLVPVLIVLLTFAAFFPVRQNGFVNWDDEGNLLENPSYRGLGWTQLRWMFTNFHLGNYRPLTWITLGFDYILWGMDPSGYHLTSLLLHATSALLFYFLTLRLLSLTLSFPAASADVGLKVAAGLAALLFSIHPLRVEPVAWISARNHVLSGLFFVWTILCYLRAMACVEGSSIRLRWLTLSVVIYGLSLLSQPFGLTLPFVLLVLDIYPVRRLSGDPTKWFWPAVRRVWWEKAPFLLLALAAGVIALRARKGAIYSFEEIGVWPRLAQALFGLAFYPFKTVIPLGLSPLYELPAHLNLSDWPFLLSGLVVAVLSAGLFVARHRWPAGLASWVCYVMILLPVLGLAQSGPQIVADRYTYSSCLGWAILAGAGLFYCRHVRSNGGTRLGISVLAVGLAGVVVLGVLTWKQTQVWHDSERLWRYVLAVTEKSYFKSSVAHNNLGVVLVGREELEEAISHYREALRIYPAYAEAHNNLGVALRERGELEDAIQHYHEALRINPAYAEAHSNLGNALMKQGELEEAISHYREALRIYPAYAEAHNNLGVALHERGELEDAIQHYREALRIYPAYAEAHSNLGNALMKQGELKEAIGQYQEALRINPGDAKAHYNLGTALARKGQLEEAIQQFRQALEIDPAYAMAHYNLATALAIRGELGEAIDHFRQTVHIEPQFAEAHESLARALIQQGKKDEAVKHYEEALRIMRSQRTVPAAGN
jgi:protein O-mannosyl-transferase